MEEPDVCHCIIVLRWLGVRSEHNLSALMSGATVFGHILTKNLFDSVSLIKVMSVAGPVNNYCRMQEATVKQKLCKLPPKSVSLGVSPLKCLVSS